MLLQTPLPLQLGNKQGVNSVKLWLDASDTSTITSSSNLVSSWRDKSGNGNNATQTTGSIQPKTGTRTINGLNVLDFDGNDFLVSSISSIANNPIMTLFMVIQYDSFAAISAPFSQGILTNINGYGVGYNSTQGKYNAFFFGSDGVDSPVAPLSQVIIERFSTDTSAMKIAINGVESSAPVSSKNITNKTVNIGYEASKRWVFNGFIAEMIVYNRALTEAETLMMENYLSNKWGVGV